MDTAGSPAHAGIDLTRCLAMPMTTWFPRTRGDRPMEQKRMRSTLEVPPHTRG